MQREHEEAMRAEFSERIELENKRFDPSTTDADLDRIWDRTSEINQRWAGGPHAEHWEFLNDAHHDWKRSPETMERFRADIAHNQEISGHVGLSDIQLRSLEQARDLTQPTVEQRPARER